MGEFLRVMEDISTDNLSQFVSDIQSVVTVILGLVTTGITILAIFIAYKFFTAKDEGARKNAKAQLIYAIIGVIVLIVLMAMSSTITSVLNIDSSFILNF